MPNKPGTRLYSGNTEVVTAGTQVQLATVEPANTPLLGVWIAADPSNTGTLVAIGGKTVGAATKAEKTLHKFVGIPLEKKQNPVFFEVQSLSEIWVDAETSKDCVAWTAVAA